MATQQLILLRHAKSDWRSGALSDFDRPLNHRGRQAAPAMAHWLSDKGLVPDMILCSSAERTRETLSLVLQASNWASPEVRFLDSLYHASTTDLTHAIAPALTDSGTLMVVGHNPGLEMLLLDYCPDAPAFADGKLMPTATVAVIELGDQQPPKLLHLKRPDKF